MPETCIVSMLVRLTSYFGYDAPRQEDLVADLLSQQLADGGLNCATRLDKHKHGSFHTSIQALEALDAYAGAGGKADTRPATGRGQEFFLRHRLYRSHRTGRDRDPRQHQVSRIPRVALRRAARAEHFTAADYPRDDRLSDAVDVVRRARRSKGRWPTYAPHPGRQWFQMEPPGASRWNTCSVHRVLQWWDQ